MSDVQATVEDTGVSAVNPKGEVMVFLDFPVENYTHFTVDGKRVTLTGRGADTHSREYGPACINALSRTRSITLMQVSDAGEAVGSTVIRKQGA